MARPTVVTPETLEKLRTGFLKGYDDEEACLYADIAPSTLYEYQKKNPEFSEQKAQWKKNPILKAKEVVYDAIERKDKETAKWYLERKKKEEFSTRSETDITSNGESLVIKFGEKK